MRRLYIEIADEAFNALAEMALDERRDVRDQAAILVEQYFRRAMAEEAEKKQAAAVDPETCPHPGIFRGEFCPRCNTTVPDMPRDLLLKVG